MTSLAPVPNGRGVALTAVPVVGFDALGSSILEAVAEGGRVVALFGRRVGSAVEVVAVVASDSDGLLAAGRARLDGPSFASLTPECPQLHLFERELAEQWALRPEGHPWPKPVRNPRSGADFYRVEGEELHEVAVGPVHAGVIEPGHFRFQCQGEHVLHLEISLGYQHRGVERALRGGPDKRSVHYAETLAGDTTVGHATAYCQLVEGLSGSRVPARALALRGIALELERLANHAGDLGALAGDIGYLPTAAYCGRLRGDFLNMSALVSGSRFGRDWVRPGGVGFDVDPERARQLLSRLEEAYGGVRGAAQLLWDSGSAQARFEDTGRVTPEAARDLGLVGLAARACGLRRDARKNHPTGIYQFVHIPISTWHTGDVFARAWLRWLEIERSAVFIRDQLRELPAGPTRVACPPARPGELCVTLVEGWRGELCHAAVTDDAGRFGTYKVVDPSFHNWTGLAMALRGQQISDFPLCNKSFNLSYCGHDL